MEADKKEVGADADTDKNAGRIQHRHPRSLSRDSDPDRGSSPKAKKGAESSCRFRRNSVRLPHVVATSPDLA